MKQIKLATRAFSVRYRNNNSFVPGNVLTLANKYGIAFPDVHGELVSDDVYETRSLPKSYKLLANDKANEFLEKCRLLEFVVSVAYSKIKVSRYH